MPKEVENDTPNKAETDQLPDRLEFVSKTSMASTNFISVGTFNEKSRGDAISGGNVSTSFSASRAPSYSKTSEIVRIAPQGMVITNSVAKCRRSYTQIKEVESQVDPRSRSSITENNEKKKFSQPLDQQIRVLTPSEIMRTLPALREETYSFSLSLVSM